MRIWKGCETIFRQRVMNYGAFLICFFLAWFIIHSAVISIDGINDEITYVDVAVVLGNKVELDGQPSPRLKARLDKAQELYEEGYLGYIIVSGGIGKEGFDEASVMKQYLVSQGVPAESVFEDSNGYNSYMTAENTRRIVDELELNSVMVISQFFHISRTKLAFRKLGFENVASAHAEIFELRDLYSIGREFPAYYKYMMK